MTHFIETLALLRWSEIKPTIFLRFTCIISQHDTCTSFPRLKKVKSNFRSIPGENQKIHIPNTTLKAKNECLKLMSLEKPWSPPNQL